MAARWRFCGASCFRSSLLKRKTKAHLLRVHYLQLRPEMTSCCKYFSSSNTGAEELKRDVPIPFSTSRARRHTLKDTLGITKEKKSNVPLFLGLGLFSVIIYFGFFFKQHMQVGETFEQALERIKQLHEDSNAKEDIDIIANGDDVK